MALTFHGSRIHLAHGALGGAFAAEVRRRALRRLLIVADGRFAERARTPLETLQRVLPDEAEAVLLEFPAGRSNAETMAGAMDLVALERCDAVVAIGCRPAIDFGKLLMRNLASGTMQRRRGAGDATLPFFIAVPGELEALRALGPTTLIAADGGRGVTALFDPGLIPDIAICDEDFLRPATPRSAAATGMGVLSDGIEAVSARGENSIADALALDAVRRIRAYLEEVARGTAAPAPGPLAPALLECLVAMQKGMGAARAIGNAVAITHAAGPSPSAHGGEAPPTVDVGAVVLPTVLEFNARSIGLPPRLEQALELPPGALADYLRGLAERLGLPASLRETGVKREELGELARIAHLDANTSTNPRQLALDDYAALLDASYC